MLSFWSIASVCRSVAHGLTNDDEKRSDYKTLQDMWKSSALSRIKLEAGSMTAGGLGGFRGLGWLCGIYA